MSARRYANVLSELLAKGRGGLKKNVPSEVGVRRTRRVLERVLGDDGLANLSDNVIHVVGTNGKGSVAWKTANTLFANNFCDRVGLYTSPHLFTVRERIRVNHEPITEEAFTNLGEEVLEASAMEDSSYFELVTVMALAHFARNECDCVVLEAGMGGIGDATNVLESSRVVALTSVALDHVAILGPTLEDVCRQKIGVVKPESRVVIGPGVPLSLDPLITQICTRNDAELIKRLLPGKSDIPFDEENARVARACVKEFVLSTQAVMLSDEARPPCRMETVFDTVTKKVVVLDVGHNPAALTALMKEMQKRFSCDDGAVVFGIAEDKDVEQCVRVLLRSKGDPWRRIVLPPLTGRGRRFAEPSRIKDLALQTLKDPMKTQIDSHVDIKTGLRNLLSDDSIKFVLVSGSHALMREALDETGHGVDEFDPFDTNERGGKDP